MVDTSSRARHDMNPQSRRFPTPRRWLLLLTMLVGGAVPLAAQIDTTNGDVDQLYRIAREKAMAGDRAEARQICQAILRRAPEYVDVRILLARTEAWDGKRDEARKELQEALRQDPTNRDALSALFDVEVWDGKTDDALLVADRILHQAPGDTEFLLKKARLLHLARRDAEALEVVGQIESVDPASPDAASLRQSIAGTVARSTIGASYAADSYSSLYSTMHYLSIEYGRRFDGGTFFARMNYSYRFLRDGLQYEADLYPVIGDGIYAYVNYGYSGSPLFPKHRVGAEVFVRLPMSLEGSLGVRSFFFDASRSVKLVTLSVNWYTGGYMLSARPYIGSGDLASSFSMSFAARRYFDDPDHYMYARLGAGFTPDERLIQTSEGFTGTEIFTLKSQTAGVGLWWLFDELYIVNPSLDFTRQEIGFQRGDYVTFVTAGITVKLRL